MGDLREARRKERDRLPAEIISHAVGVPRMPVVCWYGSGPGKQQGWQVADREEVRQAADLRRRNGPDPPSNPLGVVGRRPCWVRFPGASAISFRSLTVETSVRRPPRRDRSRRSWGQPHVRKRSSKAASPKYATRPADHETRDRQGGRAAPVLPFVGASQRGRLAVTRSGVRAPSAPLDISCFRSD